MKRKYNLSATTIKSWFKFLSHQLALHPAKLIATTVVLTLLLFVPQTWVSWQIYQDFNKIIKHEFRLQSLNNTITYLDEVLTMSARMNAATGNTIWEERYRLFEPKLDAAIKESIELAPQAYAGEEAKKTDIANQRLVEMEYKSFDLVKKSQKEAAQALLFSHNYKNEKQKYAVGVASRNHAISLQMEKKIADYRQHLYWSVFTSVLSSLLLIPSWFAVLRLLQQYLKSRRMIQTALEKTNRDLEIRVENRTQDLTDKNIQLQQALKELQYTQMQLIQQEKMFSLGQLVAGIAHEINNPINFIYGNISALEEYIISLLELLKTYQIKYSHPDEEILNLEQEIDLDFLVSDLPKILSSMRNGSKRIREIVIGLRNFSRLDEAHFKVIDIHEGLESTLLILKNRLQAKPGFPGIQIIKEYGKLPLVECYPGEINQVFMYIITNAIDVLEEKSSEKSYIRICTEVTDKNTILIRIIDNGSGIPEDVYSHLFDPFFTTKPVGKGIGLGLSISYQIVVEKHGGQLFCNSKVGEGTEFMIEIPIGLSFPSCHIS